MQRTTTKSIGLAAGILLMVFLLSLAWTGPAGAQSPLADVAPLFTAINNLRTAPQTHSKSYLHDQAKLFDPNFGNRPGFNGLVGSTGKSGIQHMDDLAGILATAPNVAALQWDAQLAEVARAGTAQPIDYGQNQGSAKAEWGTGLPHEGLGAWPANRGR